MCKYVNIHNRINILVTSGLLAVLLLFFCPELAAQQKNLKLWYLQPAIKWTDALPLGNGRLGAMVFGGLAEDRIQFNEQSLWTGRPRNYDRPDAAQYLPEIRRLLAAQQQEAAEKLAGEHFMGLQSAAGNRAAWLKEMRALKGIPGNPALPVYDDRRWADLPVPAFDGWESTGLEGLDGAVWLRTSFEVPAPLAGMDLVLDLNKVRDQDFTYINGILIGTTDGAGLSRRYTIPARLLHTGKNVLAMQVLNFSDKGGVAGYKDPQHPISIYPMPAGAPGKAISLNHLWKYRIQNDEPPAVQHFQADYQPFGDLTLNFAAQGNVQDYHRELDLSTATAKTCYTVKGVKYTREYFISQPDQAIVIRIRADRPGSVSFAAALSSPHKRRQLRRIDARTIAMTVQVRDGVLRGESMLRCEVKNGRVHEENGSLFIEHADEAVLYLCAATNFVNYKDVSGKPEMLCRKAVEALGTGRYGQVRQAHLREYQSYFSSFSIRLGADSIATMPTSTRLEQFKKGRDPGLAALYLQYGRYLLISSSRPGGMPANLQGIWNDQLVPPWGSKFTTNINLEMNYWPAEVLNLSPMHMPLFDMIDELAQSGSATAKTYYNARGWVLHHNTDIWRATAPINSATHGIWVGGAAWLTMDLWEHYLFTQDKKFLARRAYPQMKSAAAFFLDFLVKDPQTGWLISTPSNSPENGGLVAGPAMDHQIIRTLFMNCIAAAAILHTDTAFSKLLQEKYGQIAPNQIGRYGQLQEWLEDKDDPENKHRHVSHLWGVHPGNDITWENSPELMNAARKSLEMRGDEGTGWSLAWKINCWARFKDGEHAMKMLHMLISPAEKGGGTYTNLFDAHPPFQIDGNFGGAAGIAEMLLQSHTSYIDLLPALPREFAEGEVQGMVARGGFVLDMEWAAHRLKRVSVKSAAGNACNLRYFGKVVSIPTVAGKTYTFNQDLQ